MNQIIKTKNVGKILVIIHNLGTLYIRSLFCIRRHDSDIHKVNDIHKKN